MFGPKTDPRSPPSPYMLNHNGRSPYVKYRLAVNIYLFIKYFFSKMWTIDQYNTKNLHYQTV
jgi:hypothetical protein